MRGENTTAEGVSLCRFLLCHGRSLWRHSLLPRFPPGLRFARRAARHGRQSATGPCPQKHGRLLRVSALREAAVTAAPGIVPAAPFLPAFIKDMGPWERLRPGEEDTVPVRPTPASTSARRHREARFPAGASAAWARPRASSGRRSAVPPKRRRRGGGFPASGWAAPSSRRERVCRETSGFSARTSWKRLLRLRRDQELFRQSHRASSHQVSCCQNSRIPGAMPAQTGGNSAASRVIWAPAAAAYPPAGGRRGRDPPL